MWSFVFLQSWNALQKYKWSYEIIKMALNEFFDFTLMLYFSG